MNETKRRILRAAEELLSLKGASETTIAEIAQKAKVADSHAYQYFKGKKGLVFSIAEVRMKSMLNEHREQLSGILDPKSQLSKFIWYGLHYNDNHKDYVRNLVFDYRSKPEFYQTPAYKLIREHAAICRDILVKGVETGDFRNDVNLHLIREIIYGTFDAEAMSCVLSKEIKHSADNWQDINSIIFSMLTKKNQVDINNKRLRIIEAAEQIFAEHGFEKSKISTIAKQAGVAEGSIYDYFKNKEDLLFSISLLRVSQVDSFIKQSFSITKPELKLRRILKLHFSIFAQNRKFLKVFTMDTLLNRKFYESSAYEVYKNYQTRFIDILEEGIQQGEFRQDLNCRVFKNMFLGTSMHMALRWIIFPDKSFDKMNEIDEVTELFVTAAQAQEDV